MLVLVVEYQSHDCGPPELRHIGPIREKCLRHALSLLVHVVPVIPEEKALDGVDEVREHQEHYNHEARDLIELQQEVSNEYENGSQ